MCVYAGTLVSFVGVGGVVRIALYTWFTSTHVMVHKNQIFPPFSREILVQNLKVFGTVLFL